MSAPVLLTGFERSGTTLLTMMLGAHGAVDAPLSVTGAWYDFAKKLPDYNHLASPDDISRMVDAVLAHERIQLWGRSLDQEAIVTNVTPGRFDTLVYAVHQEAAKSVRKPRWAMMDIATLFRMEQAAQLFPEARFVQIVRDGRDVALSFRGYKYGGDTVLDVAHKWSLATSTMERVGRALGPERYLRLRYEDLVLDPETALTRLCGFIGVAFDPKMLDYAETVAERVPEATKTALWPALDRPPQTDKVGRWRREMTRPARYVFEDAAGEVLELFGYETETMRFSALGELYGVASFLGRGGRAKRLKARFSRG